MGGDPEKTATSQNMNCSHYFLLMVSMYSVVASIIPEATWGTGKGKSVI